ncbi:SIR2 family protein [candidate division KSB1 bacterium]|nr:SIR2 family protein [candidate division KSB1 bacterium]
MTHLILPLDAFVRAIGVDSQAPHAVFLGAGASISSGLPSAGMCIWEWKRSIFLTNNPGVERQFSELTLHSVQERIQRWLDTKGSYPAYRSLEEYSFYIEQCYPISGHRRQFFADKIRLAQPHIGYNLLCLMAEAGIITSSWTTNFDGLVTKAAASFNITPIEVGIDCQHRVVRQPRRGELLCVSLHGDYRYDELKNTDDELQQQEAQLKNDLVAELQNTALIVIGYSGRDKSVMEALEAAYSRPGPTDLYWCGFGDEINKPVHRLLETARAAGRTAYFVPTMGFDDTLTRLALHCLTGTQQERARLLLSEVSNELRDRNAPFTIDQIPCKTLIKSNAFEIDCPSEVFAFDVKKWPEKPWDWLEGLSKGRRFVAVPHQGKVLALGLLDDIRDAVGEQLSGSIERTPVTEADRNFDHGAVNALMRRVLLRALAESSGVATDCKRCLWETQAYEKKQHGGQDCYIHRAVVVHLRQFSGRLHMVVKPTVAILDAKGNELPRNVTKVIKMEILGYQHNNKFNQALGYWREKLLLTKGTFEIEFPQNCGSTYRFKIRTAPLFAQIGSRVRQQSISFDDRIRPHIKQQGIEVPEPKLLFANRSGTQYARDSHPLRGLHSNRPFDFALSSHGLAPSIRLGVVCPEREGQLLSRYLCQSAQVHQPNKTEKDYLIDYPGFQSAFGIPLEIPRPGDAAWAVCPEPKTGGSPKASSLELAKLITRSIDSVVAVEKPHVVLVFIPNRWSAWRDYRDEQEYFDLHDFVKAYCVQKGVATQFLEEHTLSSGQQCRVWWWLTVALYAKAMRTPWVLEALDPNTAFVGLGFTIDRYAAKGQHIVLGCSHLFNAQGEGLQFRLSKIENPMILGRNPHMSYDDARRVAETIRQLFFESQFRLPPRVVVHKQTRFLDEEKKGLLDGLSGVGEVDLLEINTDASLRYVSSVLNYKGENGQKKQVFDEDNFPVRRGTAVLLENRCALLWSHGATDAVIQGWKYFQGKRHIPAPLLLRRHAGSADLELLASEILGLSKMDWNSADMYSKLPATICSSRQIARIGAKLERFGPISYDYRLFM